MITFATLFLGLSLGVQPVEVLVTDDVARVELRLDGEPAATIEGPPWRVDCDFGDELAPRRLVAIAFDAAGAELGRAERRLNVPQAWAVADLLIEEGATPGSTTIDLRWESSTIAASPDSWTVTFDGKPIEVADPKRFALPPHDPDTVHFLRADLIFPGDVRAIAESVFGGGHGSAVATELTAIPTIPRGRRLQPADAARALRTAGGERLQVVAVDKGVADLVVVVDPSLPPALRETIDWRPREARSSGTLSIPGGTVTVTPRVPLDRSHRLQMVWPRARTEWRGGHSLELFPRSAVLSGDMLPPLRRDGPVEHGPVRLADAVAAAGLAAAEGNNRRAVVLLLGPRPVDGSRMSPEQVRRYLSRLRVPLAVWSLDPAAARKRTAWGEVVDVSSVAHMNRALKDLSKLLERQRVVWVEGQLLPQEVTSVDERALRLAGEVEVDSVATEEVVARP
jgi:hypothetical protein